MTQERMDPDTGIKVYEEKSEGIVTHLSRAPRILLVLYAAWSLLAVLTTAITSSSIFLDNNNLEIDGALAGLAFTWPGVALACVYLYCLREPDRYPKIFWLAAIQMTVAIIALLFHWLISEDIGAGSFIIPVAGSAALLGLTLAYILQDRDALAREQQANEKR